MSDERVETWRVEWAREDDPNPKERTFDNEDSALAFRDALWASGALCVDIAKGPRNE